MKSTVAAFMRECTPERKAVLFFPGKAPQDRTVHAVRSSGVLFRKQNSEPSFLTLKGATVEVDGYRWTITPSDDRGVVLTYTFSDE